MRRFSKFLTVAFVLLTVSALCAVIPSAATDLKPGSDRVIFISDIAKPGGRGTSADDPLYPEQDEDFRTIIVPEGDDSNYNVNTSFYQATKLLAKTGGTIVVCGQIILGNAHSCGYGANTKDVFSYMFGENTIRFTSVYNGVDYRKTADAKIILIEAAELVIQGQSIWENITVETGSTDRVLAFCEYKSLIGEGFHNQPHDEMMKDVPQYYLSVCGGHRYSRSTGENIDVTIRSGTFNKIVGSLWGVRDDLNASDCTVNFTLEGTTTVLGEIIGTTRDNTVFDGKTTFTINSGTYKCDIFGTSKKGFANKESEVRFIINGGDFQFDGIYVISERPDYIINYPAKYSLLDLSKAPEATCKGIVHGLMDNAFTEIKWPEGTAFEDYLDKKTEEELIATNSPETKPPKDEASATVQPKNENPQSDGLSTPILIAIICGSVILAAAIAVALILVIRKKKKND